MLASLKALSSFFSVAPAPAPSAGTSQAHPPPPHLTHSTHHTHPHPHPQGCHCHHHHPSSHASTGCHSLWHHEDQLAQPQYSPFAEHFIQQSRRRDLYAPYPSPIRPHAIDDSRHGSQPPPPKTRCTRCRRLKSEVEVLREQVWTLTMQVRTFQHQHQHQAEPWPQYFIGGGPEPIVLSEGRTPMKRRRGEDGDEEEDMILWAPKKKAAWIGTTARHVHGRTSSHFHDDASSMSSSSESSSSSFSTPAASSSRSSSELSPTRDRRRRPTRPISPISWEQDFESGSDRTRPGAAQGRYRSPTPYARCSPPSSPSPYTPAALLVAETAHDLPMDDEAFGLGVAGGA